MKFLIDEQLPKVLGEWLIEKGYDTVHVLNLGSDNSLSDTDINRKSIFEQRILITKDEDFFDSFFLKSEPYKLVFITTGNIKNRALLDLFREHFSTILELIQQNKLIEIKQQTIKIWA